MTLVSRSIGEGHVAAGTGRPGDVHRVGAGVPRRRSGITSRIHARPCDRREVRLYRRWRTSRRWAKRRDPRARLTTPAFRSRSDACSPVTDAFRGDHRRGAHLWSRARRTRDDRSSCTWRPAARVRHHHLAMVSDDDDIRAAAFDRIAVGQSAWRCERPRTRAHPGPPDQGSRPRPAADTHRPDPGEPACAGRARRARASPRSSTIAGARASRERAADATTSGRRMALARVDRKTPRIRGPPAMMANRLWQYHFGRGLAPHPQRLRPARPRADASGAARLAGRRRSSIGAWSLKAMHRLIMTSRTYRHELVPRAPVEALAADPDQRRLLWRFRHAASDGRRDPRLDSGRQRHAQSPDGRPRRLPTDARGDSRHRVAPRRGVGTLDRPIRPRGAACTSTSKRSLLTPLLDDASIWRTPMRRVRCGS